MNVNSVPVVLEVQPAPPSLHAHMVRVSSDAPAVGSADEEAGGEPPTRLQRARAFAPVFLACLAGLSVVACLALLAVQQERLWRVDTELGSTNQILLGVVAKMDMLHNDVLFVGGDVRTAVGQGAALSDAVYTQSAAVMQSVDGLSQDAARTNQALTTLVGALQALGTG